MFYTGKRRWSSPLSLDAAMDVPAALARFVPRHDTLFLRLLETPAEALTGSAVACALRVLQAEDAPLDELERVLADAVACLEQLPAEQQAEWRRAMHYLLLLIRYRREPEEQDELFEVVTESVGRSRKREVEEMTMTGAQELLTQGRKEGRQEGREEGRLEMLLELLDARFGPLPADVPDAVRRLPASRLKELLRRAAHADSLADLHLGPGSG